MNAHELVSYQISTSSYGQVRVMPLLLANHLNSELEQWFQNYKFISLAVTQLPESNYNTRLQLEYNYPQRLFKLRAFSEVSLNVRAEIDLLNYHQLVKIMHENIDLVYKIYSSLKENKKGDTVLNFEKHINVLCKKFHWNKFPEKLKIISRGLSLPLPLSILSQINKVRNCLEHRGGVVSKSDCDSSKNYMTIKYIYPKIISSDGEISPISDIKGEQILNVNFTEEEKRFRIGEDISFNFSDNTKMIFSINTCFKIIVDGIYDLLDVNQEESKIIIREFKNV